MEAKWRSLEGSEFRAATADCHAILCRQANPLLKVCEVVDTMDVDDNNITIYGVIATPEQAEDVSVGLPSFWGHFMESLARGQPT